MINKLKIGGLTLPTNILAAPMAGYSDRAFRLILSQMGVGLTFSEMVSAEGVCRGEKKTLCYVENGESSVPFGVQLFGARPEAFSESIARLEEGYKIDIYDLNCGCPVKKVVKRGAGVAMMKTPELIRESLGAMRRATKKPLTVKIRAGWDDKTINCVEVARIAEGEGVDAIIVHPRTAQQFFTGKSDWSQIAKVRAAVKIPVIGNGDVASREDAARMFAETGCSGVMVGRAMLGNPWVFAGIVRGEPPPLLAEKIKTINFHIDKSAEFDGERYALLTMRTQLRLYLRGVHGIRGFMSEVYKTETVGELKGLLRRFAEGALEGPAPTFRSHC